MKTKNDQAADIYICPCCTLTHPSLLDYRAHLKAQMKLLEQELNSTYTEAKSKATP